MSDRPDPQADAARIRSGWPSPLKLVLDTNVWLDAREAIGYDPSLAD